MQVAATGYGRPPWTFRGSALYQLHLVRAETARAFIPKELKLVEAFGYTLGGFFLASYEDSPDGAFDELVVIAGHVQNLPKPSAWAARVLVSSDAACDNGQKAFGISTQVAQFSKEISIKVGNKHLENQKYVYQQKIRPIPRQRKSKYSDFLDIIGLGTTLSGPKDYMEVVCVAEANGPSATERIFDIYLPNVVPGLKFNKWMEPEIKISLPSFSGLTEYNPNLLKYSCDLECRVRAVKPAKVSGPFPALNHDTDEATDSISGEPLCKRRNLIASLMLSKPLLALHCSCMKMQLDAPVLVSQQSKGSLAESLGVS